MRRGVIFPQLVTFGRLSAPYAACGKTRWDEEEIEGVGEATSLAGILRATLR
jgi:hypothetical protein